MVNLCYQKVRYIYKIVFKLKSKKFLRMLLKGEVMNQDTLVRRLRQARDNCGITQQQAADEIGVQRTAITNIESGIRSVSTLELTKLATLYRKSLSFFTEEIELQNDDLFVVLHRIAPGLDEDLAVKEQVDYCLTLWQAGATLERLLGRPFRDGPSRLMVSLPSHQSEAVKQGENLAQEERRRLGLGILPIADFPEFLTAQGIWASSAKLLDDMSGLFLHHSSIGMAILVNADHVRARQRFSYAHEYAHALLDRESLVTVSCRSNAAEMIEKRANAFAAAFLMPAGGVTEILYQMDKGGNSRQEQMIFDVATGGRISSQWRPAPGSQDITYQDVAVIAHHFGVSYQAAVYRLRSLNHISHKECEDLLKQENNGREYLKMLSMLDALEGNGGEPNDRELRNHIVHLAVEAYRREEISQGRLLDLAKTLKIPGPKLLSLAEATKNL